MDPEHLDSSPGSKPWAKSCSPTYSVNETDHILNLHIESSSFPNWNGINQKRPFTIIGDELTYIVSHDATGGTAHVVWRRAQ